MTRFAPPVIGARICEYQYTIRIRDEYATTHMGLDICGDCGDLILCPRFGKVKDIHTTDLGGLTLVVQHAANVFSRYAHTEKLLVRPGQLVYQGQPIGLVGRSGRTADGRPVGCHLHFAVTNTWVPPGTRIYREYDHLDALDFLSDSGIVDQDRRLVWKRGYIPRIRSASGKEGFYVGLSILSLGASGLLRLAR